MCEAKDACGNRAGFHVHVQVVPQPLGPDGKYGMETAPAGRSVLVCGVHLVWAVRKLAGLPIRVGGRPPTVNPMVARAVAR